MSSTPNPTGPSDPNAIERVEVRDRLEIQQAHDTLVAIILRDVQLDLDQENMAKIRGAANVLCWVLKHEYNQTFAGMLKALQHEIHARGYRDYSIGN